MRLNLEGDGSDLAESEQLRQKLSVEVGDTQILDVSLRHTQLHLRPELFERFVRELIAFRRVDVRPVKVEQIDVAQLHQLQGLLHFSLNAFALQIEDLRRYEQFLSLHSALGYHCLYGVSEGDFVVVHSRSIDVAAGAQL